MPDLPRPPLPSMRERRERSVTDPVDPKHVGETKSRSMTVIAESAPECVYLYSDIQTNLLYLWYMFFSTAKCILCKAHTCMYA